MISHKETLRSAITEQREIAAGLEVKLDEARACLADLERELARLEESVALPITRSLPFLQGPVPETADDKITLFRRLFAGREDVFPRLWTNQRTGKKGYALACENEWVPGVCRKPRVKCGECPDRGRAHRRARRGIRRGSSELGADGWPARVRRDRLWCELAPLPARSAANRRGPDRLRVRRGSVRGGASLDPARR